MYGERKYLYQSGCKRSVVNNSSCLDILKMFVSHPLGGNRCRKSGFFLERETFFLRVCLYWPENELFFPGKLTANVRRGERRASLSPAQELRASLSSAQGLTATLNRTNEAVTGARPSCRPPELNHSYFIVVIARGVRTISQCDCSANYSEHSIWENLFSHYEK